MFSIHSKLVLYRILLSVTLAVASAVAIPHVAFAQSDPLIGTWKLNLARSTYTPGSAPRSATLSFQNTGGVLTDTAEAVLPDGSSGKLVLLQIYHGQPHPTTGSADLDSSAYTKVDANTIICTRMKGGKVITVGTEILSADGRTLTISATGINAAGQKLSNVTVYEKQ
jgi:hypothetical protein